MLTCKTYEIEHGLAGGVSFLVGGGGQLHTQRVPIKLLVVSGLWTEHGIMSYTRVCGGGGGVEGVEGS